MNGITQGGEHLYLIEIQSLISQLLLIGLIVFMIYFFLLVVKSVKRNK